MSELDEAIAALRKLADDLERRVAARQPCPHLSARWAAFGFDSAALVCPDCGAGLKTRRRPEDEPAPPDEWEAAHADWSAGAPETEG